MCRSVNAVKASMVDNWRFGDPFYPQQLPFDHNRNIDGIKPSPRLSRGSFIADVPVGGLDETAAIERLSTAYSMSIVLEINGQQI